MSSRTSAMFPASSCNFQCILFRFLLPERGNYLLKSLPASCVHFRVVHKQDPGFFLQKRFRCGQAAPRNLHHNGILAALCLIHQPICTANNVFHGVGNGLYRSADAQRDAEMRIAGYRCHLCGRVDLFQFGLQKSPGMPGKTSRNSSPP